MSRGPCSYMYMLAPIVSSGAGDDDGHARQEARLQCEERIPWRKTSLRCFRALLKVI